MNLSLAFDTMPSASTMHFDVHSNGAGVNVNCVPVRVDPIKATIARPNLSSKPFQKMQNPEKPEKSKKKVKNQKIKKKSLVVPRKSARLMKKGLNKSEKSCGCCSCC